MGIRDHERSSVQVIDREARENAIRTLVWLAKYPDDREWAAEMLRRFGATELEISAAAYRNPE
jgi:predicted alpha-1,6-mannanase (GH76 family)